MAFEFGTGIGKRLVFTGFWPIFSAKDGPNILFQTAPNLESIESALADLPKDVKFLVFQLTGCGILFYAIFYFSSFIATGTRFFS